MQGFMFCNSGPKQIFKPKNYLLQNNFNQLSKMKKLYLLILILNVASLIVKAQTSGALDNFILKQMNTGHIPGLEAAIIKDGKIAWSGGYGKADIDKDIPFTANTIHSGIASISKTIIATALMQLYEQGYFQLD